MPVYIQCQFCGQTKANATECMNYGDTKDCSTMASVQCTYRGGCVHGKCDPPLDCDAPNCMQVCEPTTPAKPDAEGGK